MGNKQSGKKSFKNISPLDYNPEIYPIYKLIGRHGGGILVDLMKNAHKSKDYKEIDNFIQSEISKYVLNNGKGEEVIKRKP